jgi:hypothetical protein
MFLALNIRGKSHVAAGLAHGLVSETFQALCQLRPTEISGKSCHTADILLFSASWSKRKSNLAIVDAVEIMPILWVLVESVIDVYGIMALMAQNTPAEIIFQVQDDIDGGFVAEALGHPIVTQADSMEELKNMIRDAVRCHFDEGARPSVIRLHMVKDEVISA